MSSSPPTRGEQLIAAVQARYDLTPTEDALVFQLASTLDEIDRMTVALAGAEPIVKGSTGQDRPHPLLLELRQHRMLAKDIAKLLALPDSFLATKKRPRAGRLPSVATR